MRSYKSAESSGDDLNPDWLGALEPQGLLREALEAGNVGIWAWDLAADVFCGDPIARKLWSFPEHGSVAAAQALSAVHPMDVAAFHAAAVAARVSGEFQAVLRLRGADGEFRWLRVRGRSDRTAGKERIVGITVDVSDRKRVEADLTQTEKRLRRAQDLGGAIPFEWDGRRDRLIAPPSFKALYGVGTDETFSLETFLDRVHPEDRGRVEEDHRRLMAEPGPYESEFRAVMPDGS
ncbi:MAG: PAS domain-containing protein, partial [Pseudomonadota bacterium]|nr:PAS domain-containing protein [Pseudomonadota bacterium]